MYRRTIALAAGLIAAAGTGYAQLQAEGIYWLVAPQGTGSVGIEGIEGTTFDVEDDLGYGDAEGTFGANLYLGDRHQLGVGFVQLDVSADNQLDKNLTYQDLLFRVNTKVESSLEATLIRGFYRMNLGNDQLRGGILLGGQYLDLTGEVSSVDVGRASAAIKVGMPIVGGYLRIDPMPYLSLRGLVNGLSWKFEDVEATYWDAEGSAQLTLPQGLYLGAGYRHLVIDATDDAEAIEVDLTFSGPFVVAGFEW